MSNFQKLTAQQVMRHVDEGHTVYADSFNYRVVKSKSGQYYIASGQHRIGLTWEDGRTLNATKFHVHTPKEQETNAASNQMSIQNASV